MVIDHFLNRIIDYMMMYDLSRVKKKTVFDWDANWLTLDWDNENPEVFSNMT